MFFEYVKRAHQLFGTEITEERSQKVMKALTVNQELVRDCVDGTFITYGDTDSPNWLLERFQQEWKAYGTALYPALTINMMTFNGQLTPDNAFEAICASFNEEPKQCERFQLTHHIKTPEYQQELFGVSNAFLLVLIAILIVINVCIITLYRRFLDKELEKELQMQVSSSVSQYIALSQLEGKDQKIPDSALDAIKNETKSEEDKPTDQSNEDDKT